MIYSGPSEELLIHNSIQIASSDRSPRTFLSVPSKLSYLNPQIYDAGRRILHRAPFERDCAISNLEA